MTNEKEPRLNIAAFLLKMLKRIGLSQRSAAEYLQVSPTTASHWSGTQSGKGKNIGAPNDEQLERMVGLLWYQTVENMKILMNLVEGDFLRPREKELLLKAIEPDFKETAKWLTKIEIANNKAAKETEKMIREIHQRCGNIGLIRYFSPVQASWGSPSPQEAGTKSGISSDFDLETFLSSAIVSDKDVLRMKDKIKNYVVEKDEKNRKALLKPGKKTRKMKQP